MSLRRATCGSCGGDGKTYIPTPKTKWKRERHWVEVEETDVNGKPKMVGHWETNNVSYEEMVVVEQTCSACGGSGVR